MLYSLKWLKYAISFMVSLSCNAFLTIIGLQVKDLAHIWELGGGGSLANLLEIVLNDQNIE